MATTTVSAWAKPGAWALEAEENDAAEELIQQQEKEKEQEQKSKIFQFRHQQKEEQQTPLSDFPSLSAAVATKTKKKKAVPISLSEFQTGSSINKNSAPAAAKGLTTDELLSLPTGPRERTAEEIQQGSGRIGGGFRSYGTGRDGGSEGGRRDGGGFRDRENTRDSGPSRADESGDWGAKKSMGGGGERPERRSGGGGFFDSQSRADETDDWGAAKRAGGGGGGFPERRERGPGGGFPDTGSRADESDSWVSNKSRVSSMAPPRRGPGGGFESGRREGFGFQKENSNGGGPDSDTWGKKREEGSTTTVMGNGGARPKLVLKPRTLSPTNGEEQPGSVAKAKGSNPFGEARPREEILAEKGQDWKKIDEQFDSVKIKENWSNGTGPNEGSGKMSFGNDNGSETERSWRKPESHDVSPTPSAEVENEDGGVAAETETAAVTAI